MKQLQISEALFVKLVKYFYSEEIGYDDEELFDLEREIKKELQKKLDKISMRSYYTKYKTAETEQEREEARKKYLDEKGVPESFRWTIVKKVDRGMRKIGKAQPRHAGRTKVQPD